MTINEEAAKQLITYINNGIDFATAQLPQVAIEILHWGVIIRSIGFLIPLMILIGMLIWGHNNYQKSPWSNESVFLFSLSLSVPILLIIGNGYVLLKILAAPRVYLLDYISHLL